MRMELGQLEALVAVVDLGSFTAAAQQLHLTQPALSRRIAGLESATKLRLFDRLERRVQLTAAGQGLLPYARRALGEARSLEAAVNAMHGVHSGALRIAGLPSLVVTDLAELVGAFRRAHPNVELLITAVSDVDDAHTSVAEARCDVALSDVDAHAPELAVLPYSYQDFVAVFPPGTGLHAPDDDFPVLEAEHLTGRALVTLPPGTLTRTLTDSVYASLDTEPAHVVTTTERDALVPLALSGAGITFVPHKLALEAAARGAEVALPAPRVTRHLGLIFREEAKSPALTAFLRVAEAVVSSGG